tara:strand:+ start:1034 stop:1231 length:198 start_codon:yes stop_codon:yes gene_type:complete
MKENTFNKFASPIPPHLTPEEREEWEEEYEWELQERERRKKEGLERSKKKRRGWKLIQKLFKKGG